MILSHFLYIYIQSSFKFTIEFVGPNVDPINPKVDKKKKCTRDVQESFLFLQMHLFLL